MNTVPFVDENGYFVEDILVLGDRPYTGVSLHYKVDVDPSVRGYTVGYPIPTGLYKPKLDIDRLIQEFGEDTQSWPQGHDDTDTSMYWIEGLTPEEIKNLTKQEPSELDKLREETASKISELWEFSLFGGA